ncbi:MAG: Stage II sporulation protein R (spore_II_R) [Pelotomaculum sp. PtaU1.Bin035]|nr:MAG: Stage II sporulation protein R (spore_II_R) [Pelotomaculum sp. PtaU1.Bin035]
MNIKSKVTMAGLFLLAAMMLTGGLQHKTPEKTYPSDHLIRLHIVANSDSASDQELKRKVRDEIIRCVARDFLGAGNIDTARTIARSDLTQIKETASREIKENGQDYPVNVELDSFTFPTKHYGPFVLPAGDYEAVRVIIGSGGGTNWWCVLFPPLCFVDMSKGMVISQPGNNGPAPVISTQNVTFEKEQPPDAATTQKPDAFREAANAATNGETIAKVEFRFKILDFFRNLHSI